MSPLVPTQSGLTYLTLEELEVLAWDFRDQGVGIFAAEGPSGPEWLLRAKVHGVEVTFRAHRAVNAEAIA